jgi:hypothetical protein
MFQPDAHTDAALNQKERWSDRDYWRMSLKTHSIPSPVAEFIMRNYNRRHVKNDAWSQFHKSEIIG